MYADTINLFNSAEKHNKTQQIKYKKTPINGSIIITAHKFLFKLIHIGYENNDFL